MVSKERQGSIRLINYKAPVYQMRNESSITQWASLVMRRDVTSLREVENLKFFETILKCIDPQYFTQIDSKSISTHTGWLEAIETYYREQIGSNVSHFMDGLNVHKDIFRVWELLLGMAIKGNNRNNNINIIILEMDPSLQAEIMTLVTEIIGKFGEDVSANTEAFPLEPQIDRDSQKKAGKNQQMLVNLFEENQELKESIERIQEQLRREKTENIAAFSELEERFETILFQKRAFLEVLTNANLHQIETKRDDENALSLFKTQATLPEIGKDIVHLVNDQLKDLKKTVSKLSALEEESKELKKVFFRMSEELESLQIQAKATAKIEKEQDQLRRQNVELTQRQNAAIKTIAELEEKIWMLMEVVKAQNQTGSQESFIQDKPVIMQIRAEKEERSLGELLVLDHSKSSSERKYHAVNLEADIDEADVSVSLLQKDLDYYQQAASQLKEQNSLLRAANDALRKEAQQFLRDHQSSLAKLEAEHAESTAAMRIALEQAAKVQSQPEKKDESTKVWLGLVKSSLQQFKDRELAYQQTVSCLKNEFYQTILPTRQLTAKVATGKTDPVESPPKIETISPQTVAEPMKILSYIDLQEGEDIDEETASFKHNTMKSQFCNVESQIEFYQRAPEETKEEPEIVQFTRINKKAESEIKRSLFVLNDCLAAQQPIDFKVQIEQIRTQYGKIHDSYSDLCSKLNLFAKREHVRPSVDTLQEINALEQQIQANSRSEIVKLQAINCSLRSLLKQCILQKKQVSQKIIEFSQNPIQNSSAAVALSSLLSEMSDALKGSFSESLGVLNELTASSEEASPFEVVQRMYQKERERNATLQMEIELLACALLELRNMVSID